MRASSCCPLYIFPAHSPPPGLYPLCLLCYLLLLRLLFLLLLLLPLSTETFAAAKLSKGKLNSCLGRRPYAVKMGVALPPGTHLHNIYS